MCPGGRWILSISFGSCLEVVGFDRVRLVRPRAPWGSLDSFGLVSFVWVQFGGRWVSLGSSGSFGCAMLMAEFVLVITGYVWVPLCRFGIGLVHLGSFGSLRLALGFLGLIHLRLVLFAGAQGVVWFV